jgi:hypothetical protein
LNFICAYDFHSSVVLLRAIFDVLLLHMDPNSTLAKSAIHCLLLLANASIVVPFDMTSRRASDHSLALRADAYSSRSEERIHLALIPDDVLCDSRGFILRGT